MVDERVAAEEEGCTSAKGNGLSRVKRPAPREAVGSDGERPSLRDFESGNALMREVVEFAHLAASEFITVLIQGETGTGKDMLAEAIHNASERGRGPFVKVNCGALPETLLESELFGYTKGAFTGAVSDQPGRIRLAHNGTLYLTEIGDLPLSLQVKLLTFLDDKVVYPLGGSRSSRADVRIIAATNCDLEAMVAAGRFRIDLFYRLDECGINLPPLRSRAEDVERLAYRFLEKLGRTRGKAAERLHPEALDALRRHPWPGNVRQLHDVIQLAGMKCSGAEIGLEHLPKKFLVALSVPRPRPAPPRESSMRVAPFAPASPAGENGRDVPSMDDLVKQAELYGIPRALKALGGNVTQAAEALERSRSWLVEKMGFHGINREDFVGTNEKAGTEPP